MRKILSVFVVLFDLILSIFLFLFISFDDKFMFNIEGLLVELGLLNKTNFFF